MIAALHTLDLFLLKKINTTWTSTFLDRLLPIIMEPEFFYLPIALVVLALLLWGGFRERMFVWIIGLWMLLGDHNLVCWMKSSTHRLRPMEAIASTRVVRLAHDSTNNTWTENRDTKRGRSFPSGHASNNAAIAFAAFFLYRRRWTAVLFAWAFLISYGRVYMGVHYPSDVVGGWFLAGFFIASLMAANNILWQKFGPRWMPEAYKKLPNLWHLPDLPEAKRIQ